MISPAESRRVEALTDALPYIQRFRGQTFVVKYGGSAMEDVHLVERTLRDVVFLEAVGIQLVVVHGGGKLISDRMRAAGLRARFVNGLRVTDEATIAIVAAALDEAINPMIVDKLRALGAPAVGLRGRDVFLARRLPPVAEGGKEDGPLVDVGFVGEVSRINLTELSHTLARRCLPVLSPLGQDEADAAVTLNVNADVAAAALAGALRATRLLYLSDVPGLMRDPTNPESLIPSLHQAQVARLITEGVIVGGMLPKVESAVSALAQGVGGVQFVDGRLSHALLLATFTNLGIGTEILP